MFAQVAGSQIRVPLSACRGPGGHEYRYGTPLDSYAVRVLCAVAHLPVAFTEGDAPDSATVVVLHPRGITRRRARAGYLELTDDAPFSLMPGDPHH